MNKRGSADKIKLSSFDDLFGTQEAGTGTEQVQEIPLCEVTMIGGTYAGGSNTENDCSCNKDR